MHPELTTRLEFVGYTADKRALLEMDRATQQNAAMVEETSAAAQNLAREVDKLASQANSFHVAETAPAAAAGPSAKARATVEALGTMAF